MRCLPSDIEPYAASATCLGYRSRMLLSVPKSDGCTLAIMNLEKIPFPHLPHIFRFHTFQSIARHLVSRQQYFQIQQYIRNQARHLRRSAHGSKECWLIAGFFHRKQIQKKSSRRLMIRRRLVPLHKRLFEIAFLMFRNARCPSSFLRIIRFT